MLNCKLSFFYMFIKLSNLGSTHQTKSYAFTHPYPYRHHLTRHNWLLSAIGICFRLELLIAPIGCLGAYAATYGVTTFLVTKVYWLDLAETNPETITAETIDLVRTSLRNTSIVNNQIIAPKKSPPEWASVKT